MAPVGGTLTPCAYVAPSYLEKVRCRIITEGDKSTQAGGGRRYAMGNMTLARVVARRTLTYAVYSQFRLVTSSSPFHNIRVSFPPVNSIARYNGPQRVVPSTSLYL